MKSMHSAGTCDECAGRHMTSVESLDIGAKADMLALLAYSGRGNLHTEALV